MSTGGAGDAVWRTLGEVCHLKAGKAISAQDISSEKTSAYSVPCYGGNGLRGFVQAANQQGDKSIIGRQGALCGNVCYATGDYYATEHAVVVTDKGYFNSRFLYHVLVHKDLNQYKTAGAQPGLSVAKLETILVPVPNMALQNRIAHVLDNFDAICSDLNIGLPAEIEARQKQYEYYRDLLLSFDCSQLVHVERERSEPARRDVIRLLQYVFGYVLLPLKETAELFRGEYITKKSTKIGEIPVILGGQEPAYYIDKSNHTGEVVVIARSGVSAGFVSYWNEPIFITDGFGYEARDGIVIPKFLYYILKNREAEFNAMKRGAGVPHVSGEALGQVLLKIPTLEDQERIISILDRFDTLCNDLTSGLPAEIEARQRQYEYYRDKLLTFKELNA